MREFGDILGFFFRYQKSHMQLKFVVCQEYQLGWDKRYKDGTGMEKSCYVDSLAFHG